MLAPPSLFKHNLLSLSSVPRAPVGVLWVSPIPRTYTYLYESGSVKSFAELLTNIFIPLWEVGIPPPPFPFLEARAKVPKHVMPCFRVSSQAAGWQAPPYGMAIRGGVLSPSCAVEGENCNIICGIMVFYVLIYFSLIWYNYLFHLVFQYAPGEFRSHFHCVSSRPRSASTPRETRSCRISWTSSLASTVWTTRR